MAQSDFFGGQFLSFCVHKGTFARYFCKLLGGINGIAGLLWGFAASLAANTSVW